MADAPDKPLFDVIRRIKGDGLTTAEVAAVKQTLGALTPSQSPAAPPAALPHFRIMAQHLEAEEGRKAHAYKDHLGFWTIGVGRLIDPRKGGRLTNAEIDMLLANDIREKIAALASNPGTKAAWAAVKDDPYRATALLSMAFQMGVEGLADFTGSLPLVVRKDWKAAAATMLKSLWAKQTPERAKRVTQMLATGKPA